MAPSDNKSSSTRSRKNFERTRWLYQKAGRDLGPYTPSEIFDLMRKGEVVAGTQIRQSTGQQWRPLSQVAEYAPLLAKLKKEQKQRARDQAMDAVEESVRTNRKLPMIIIVALTGCVVVAGVIYGGYQWREMNSGSASGYSTSLFRDLALDKVPKRAYLDTRGNIKWPSEHVPNRKARVKRAKRRSSDAGARQLPNPVKGADDLKPTAPKGVTEMAFDKAPTGRELNSRDINTVRSNVVPKLVQCAQKEASRRAGFPGTTVSFTIKPSGSVGSVRVGANGKRSRAFVGCARRAVKGTRVAPFDGAGRTITVPLKVGR